MASTTDRLLHEAIVRPREQSVFPRVRVSNRAGDTTWADTFAAASVLTKLRITVIRDCELVDVSTSTIKRVFARGHRASAHTIRLPCRARPREGAVGCSTTGAAGAANLPQFPPSPPQYWGDLIKVRSPFVGRARDRIGAGLPHGFISVGGSGRIPSTNTAYECSDYIGPGRARRGARRRRARQQEECRPLPLPDAGILPEWRIWMKDGIDKSRK